MTNPQNTRVGLQTMLSAVAVSHHEPPAVIRRRRVIVTVVLVIGAALLGYSLTREVGDKSFYWLTLALAAVWSIGALVSGPLHLGRVRFRGRNKRPVLTGTLIGLSISAVFVVGGLIVREIPVMRDYVVSVLQFANQGSLSLVVFITVINGIAEELFFRGALYSALGRYYPAVISTILYIAAVMATGNPMLGFAALVLGSVCAWERRFTGGVLAPTLTHFVWGLIMVLVLPPMFGV